MGEGQMTMVTVEDNFAVGTIHNGHGYKPLHFVCKSLKMQNRKLYGEMGSLLLIEVSRCNFLSFTLCIIAIISIHCVIALVHICWQPKGSLKIGLNFQGASATLAHMCAGTHVFID
jgi:hypothetical protein